MSISASIQESINNGGELINNVNALTAEASQRLAVPVADSVTDQLTAFTLDVSQIVAFYMSSDQDLTVETNDGTTPGDTIALVAGVPLVWHNQSYHANPFSVDITALYLTNASGAAATFRLSEIHDPTV